MEVTSRLASTGRGSSGCRREKASRRWVRAAARCAEVDAAEAFTEAVARQTAYQAAMLASSRVMGLSLADYLR